MRPRRQGYVPPKLDFNHYMHFFTGEDLEDRGAFPSPEAAKAAWDHHRDELMERRGGQAGTRPWGYWAYERGEELPADRVESVLRLLEAGELSDAEREKILSEAKWAQEHQDDPDYSFTSPPEAAERMTEHHEQLIAEALALGRLLDGE
jgi:hypothetical protein